MDIFFLLYGKKFLNSMFFSTNGSLATSGGSVVTFRGSVATSDLQSRLRARCLLSKHVYWKGLVHLAHSTITTYKITNPQVFHFFGKLFVKKGGIFLFYNFLKNRNRKDIYFIREVYNTKISVVSDSQVVVSNSKVVVSNSQVVVSNKLFTVTFVPRVSLEMTWIFKGLSAPSAFHHYYL